MDSEIKGAIEVLKEGGIILYPTDTIWGLGCDATNKEAVQRIFDLKERAESKSLITLVADEDMLCKYVKEIPAIALQLIEVNDKPMTIIYPQGVGLESVSLTMSSAKPLSRSLANLLSQPLQISLERRHQPTMRIFQLILLILLIG